MSAGKVVRVRFVSVFVALFSISIAGPALAVPGLFPGALLDQNTIFSDTDVGTAILGAPDATDPGQQIGSSDKRFLGLGNATVTFDFGLAAIVDGTGGDFNIYELPIPAVEFHFIGQVLVSANGVDFFDVKASEGAGVALDNDGGVNLAFVRSYDISGVVGSLAGGEARYVRLVGSNANSAGSTSGFDLDAIGAINFTGAATSIPAPPALALFLAGLVAALRLRSAKSQPA